MKTVVISGANSAVGGWFTKTLSNIAINSGKPVVVLNETICKEYAIHALQRAERVIIISPVYWGRLPGKLEAWLDEVLLPGKIYKFVDIPVLTKYFGFKRSQSLCNIKEFICVLSYGAPSAATFGIPFFRLGFMIGKLVLGAKRVRHIPTYLCEGDDGWARRELTKNKVKELFNVSATE